MRGKFVLSAAGRDKDRIFAVTDVIDESFVFIADGMLRKIEKPKKKKLKHLKILDAEKAELSGMTNRGLAAKVKELSALTDGNWRDCSAKG